MPLREHALAPWRAHVVVGRTAAVSRRDCDFDAPIVTFARGGDRYLNPEVVVNFKAKARRPNDEHGLAAALPLLSDLALAFLVDSLARQEPGHAWLDRL